MPYKITSVTTKPSHDTPNFDEWLQTVPESVLVSFPDAAGKSPIQVIEDSVVAQNNLAAGFISQRSVPDNDDLVWTWESIWNSKEDWINAVSATSFIDTNVRSASSFLRSLYLTENNITVVNFEANI